jgi:hypothetical protein
MPAQPSAGSPRDPVKVFVGAAVATFLVTAVELLLALLAFPGTRPALVLLMVANFALGALFYQGLWYDRPLYRALFGLGFLFGVVATLGIAFLLGLGRIGGA